MAPSPPRVPGFQDPDSRVTPQKLFAEKQVFLERLLASQTAFRREKTSSLPLLSKEIQIQYCSSFVDIRESGKKRRTFAAKLHFTSLQQLKLRNFLLSAGAHVEALDKLGLTPFLCAVFNGTLAVMNVLISWGCDVSAKTNAGNGALALVSSNGHLDIARKLVVMGFSANERHQVGYTSLHWASQQGHARICYFLISSGANIEALEEFEYTPFLCAAYNGNSEVLKILFRRGCNVFAQNSDGCGALALASRSGHLCIARELVDMGCRINEPDKSDYTALHWACAEGHAETVEYLVSAGADTNAKNAFGRTPLLEADFKKQYDVVAALVQILGSQISVQNSSEDNQSEVSETTFQESYVMPEEDKNSFESNCRKSDEDTDEIFQKIYDEALKR
ncbi:ankyrin repeat domain-containing protein 29-like [Oscarella lobularis]|uniref:ankyrin repeat domain-containing protein 29-like n=1 Tax=Oscarella lobularis TaxID=121494 RepID=UPI003313E8DD